MDKLVIIKVFLLLMFAFLLYSCEKDNSLPEISIITKVSLEVDSQSVTIKGSISNTYGQTVSEFGHYYGAYPEDTFNLKSNFGSY